MMKRQILWLVYGALTGMIVGSAAALFLAGLEYATYLQIEHFWLLYVLPLAGAAVSLLYARFGRNSSKGNNLIIEQVRRGDRKAESFEEVPFRMAPFILIGTWITHLFGGSAGREGTAVQMGGSLADWLSRLLKADAEGRRVLLLCGISAGFGSVFGTPWAGMIFALEAVTMGRRVAFSAILPCLAAALIGNYTTLAWGIAHLAYDMGEIPSFSWMVVLNVMLASIAFGLMSLLFAVSVQGFKLFLLKLIAAGWARAFVGGLIVIALVYAADSRDYLGLSLQLLLQSFQEDLPAAAFIWKTIFTVVTLGSGYLGGEVTPLFVIGATLGSSLAPFLHMNAGFLAGLGLIAVFAGAANAPIACFVLGMELFGAAGAGYMLLACVVSYMVSGHTGIYSAQLAGVNRPKYYIRVPGIQLLHQQYKKRRNARL
ncbi:chloride channel protein [Paenibacillus montanisoli]|uniref:Voltage-gated chloride channel protein n=1 Tax=Paenibacillus montanisoli TaxID=2081970 RepID=A0A328U870_9BACL|nr:chloride channel protein [Paenibacillus montanisoli]RAP78282.1 voltage-gated chloride channel protein [Paenibacillus montanisoli]